MTTLEFAQHPPAGRVHYRDRKRWGWMLAVVFTLLPLTGVAAHALTGEQIALGLPLLVSFGLMPLLDWLVGEDASNPCEVVLPWLDVDPYYRWLIWLTVPLHFAVLIGCAWWAGTQELAWWAVTLLAVSAGIGAGMAINVGHELGHKHNRLEQWLARLVLAVPAFGHYTVDHGRGHHRWVATPQDPSSARMGESIYRFAWRKLHGAIGRAWTLERERLAEQQRGAWSLHNTVLQSWAISVVLQSGLLWAFGWVMLPFLALHNFVAWWQLTTADYVEHYGLLRQRLPNGQYEAPQLHHSWNTDHLISNLALFHLQRHSDHHAHPSRRYQSLRHHDGLPQLPSGYFSMFPLAFIAPLWFRVMDRRLLALPQVRADLNRVNMDPKRRKKILARYGAARGPSDA